MGQEVLEVGLGPAASVTGSAECGFNSLKSNAADASKASLYVCSNGILSVERPYQLRSAQVSSQLS